MKKGTRKNPVQKERIKSNRKKKPTTPFTANMSVIMKLVITV